MSLQPPAPLVYEVVEPTTAQTTVLDVVVGAVAVAGAVAGIAVVFGLLFAGVMIGLKRLRGQGDPAGGVRLGLGGG